MSLQAISKEVPDLIARHNSQLWLVHIVRRLSSLLGLLRAWTMKKSRQRMRDFSLPHSQKIIAHMLASIASHTPISVAGLYGSRSALWGMPSVYIRRRFLLARNASELTSIVAV